MSDGSRAPSAADQMCEACPRRVALASLRTSVTLLRVVGAEPEAEAAEKELQELESAGCPSWWGQPYMENGKERIEWRCAWSHLPRIFASLGQELEGGKATLQAAREEAERRGRALSVLLSSQAPTRRGGWLKRLVSGDA